VRSGPGEARTILLLHIISVRPSKQLLMVLTFLKVYMELGSSFLFLREQIKDIIIIIHTDRTVVFPFCTSNVMRSVRTSHLLLSSEISRPSSARVSSRSLMGSPRCDFTFNQESSSSCSHALC
jgi:hypothetical protein